ncbi:MAG TPA: hypothetical protein PK411_14440, partial [Mesotoga infera]|nr:hypothetical protein [Mesotoga infera]HRV03077.1 hypothetical protein [Mesotoga sp.]
MYTIKRNYSVALSILRVDISTFFPIIFSGFLRIFIEEFYSDHIVRFRACLKPASNRLCAFLAFFLFNDFKFGYIDFS